MDKSEYFTNRAEYYRRKLGGLRSNMQNLRAVRKKMFRDYLPFYKGLASTYKVGSNKKAADEAVRMVDHAVVLLDEILQGDRITSQDAEMLYGLVDALEEKRQYFIDQAVNVQAVNTRLERLTEEMGVSVEDLGVTPELARQAVRRDAGESRAQGLSKLLRGQFSRTRGVGAQVLGGVGTALAGPFTPLFRMGLGAGRDIAGFAGSLLKKAQESKQAEFVKQFRPVAAEISVEDLAREQQPAVSAFRGAKEHKLTVEEQVQSLHRFFDKEAYRAKWTKDLLGAMRDLTQGRKAGGLSGVAGLTDTFKDLGLAITPFIGKAGLYAGLAVGVGVSIKKFTELDSAIGKFLSAQGKRQKAADELGRVTDQKLDKIKEMGIQEFAFAVGKSPRHVAVDVASAEQQQLLESWASRPWYRKSLDFWSGKKPPKIQPFYQRVAEIEKLTRPGSQESQSTMPPFSAPTIPGLNDLDATIKQLIEQLQKEKFDSTPTPAIGNPYDSADTLLGPHADGNLTLGDW